MGLGGVGVGLEVGLEQFGFCQELGFVLVVVLHYLDLLPGFDIR